MFMLKSRCANSENGNVFFLAKPPSSAVATPNQPQQEYTNNLEASWNYTGFVTVSPLVEVNQAVL